MPFQIENTDWNRHHGVDACLLGNWVEHRANGNNDSQKNEKGRYLDHANLLSQQVTNQEDAVNRTISVSNQAAQSVFEKPQARPSLGKQRALIEAELLKQARSEMQPIQEQKSTNDWISTFKADFGKPSDEPPKQLDTKTLEKFSNPITFWNHQAKFIQGNVNTSIAASVLKQQQDESLIRFGKRTAFSTPIAHSLDA